MANRGHIIIVNDNPVDADDLQELLENNGYRVDKKANGKDYRVILELDYTIN